MVIARTLKTRTARQYRIPLWLQEKASDDWEGTVVWTDVADGLFYADVKPKQYVIRVEGQEETIVDKLLIYTAWRPMPGLENDCVQRFRTQSEGLFYYIESVVSLNTESREYEIRATQRLEQIDPGSVPLLPLVSGTFWETLEGETVIRLKSGNSLWS